MPFCSSTLTCTDWQLSCHCSPWLSLHRLCISQTDTKQEHAEARMCSHLRILLKLGVEAFPSPLIRVGDGDVFQLGYALLQQRDAALEQRQHVVAKVEAFLLSHKR